jgi:hypothetical protein
LFVGDRFNFSAFDQLSKKSEEEQKARITLETELATVLKQNEEFKHQLSIELSLKKVCFTYKILFMRFSKHLIIIIMAVRNQGI